MSQKKKLLRKFLGNPVSLRYSDIQVLLLSLGFVLVSIRGSHQKWHHPGIKKTLIIPVHHGDCDSVYKIYILKCIIAHRIHTLFPL